MMSDDEIIAVVQAHKEGKHIQSRLKDEYYRELAWLPLPVGTTVFWNFIKTDYRVAPEPRKPREGWIHAFRLHDSREEIQEHYGNLDGTIHVREVID